jgi:hypothetical protein
MNIHSDLELPELEPLSSMLPDLIFRREVFSRPIPKSGQAVFEFGETDAYIGFGGVGHFLLPKPGIVVFDYVEGSDPALLSLGLLGTVMATVLHRRGLLTMHASAVEIGGRGTVFLGDKGAGKSTTAAGFISAGHRLVADDVLPIDLARDGTCQILPGYPQLKLSEAASRSIALPEATAIPISDIGFYKRRLRLDGSFSSQPVKPAVFYVLASGDNLQTIPLFGAEAMKAVMANSYHVRFGLQVFHGAVAAAHMQQCAAMVRAVPVRVLNVPRDLNRLPELVSFVEHDVGLT